MNQDIKLMSKFKNGDKESFEKLVLKYREAAVSFSLKYVKDYQIAEDIVQESFATVFVYKERYDIKYSFRTYLFTIIKNKSIDYLRKRRELPLELKFPLKAYDDVEDEVIRKQEGIKVREKIEELNNNYKTVIYLIDFQNYSYKEAAKIMGKTVTQIKILIFRARKKLKLLIEKEV